MTDKILVTNGAALKKKYNGGRQAVLNAVRELVIADKSRGLNTRLVDISDLRTMKALKCTAVTSPGNGRQCKRAVDAIFTHYKPDYLVLVGSPDIIPHLKLNNPTPGDGDDAARSDLPYASDAPYTSRDPAKYASVTRAVGRITGITGAENPDFLVKQLQAAASYKGRKRANYTDYFAISAHVWRGSTEMSVENIFGSDAIKICPPSGSPRVSKLLAPLSHFINCHGAEVDPQFYGQKGNNYPIAMNSTDVKIGTKRDAIVAAECCYGAELFDPEQSGDALPISNSYLGAGAIGFLGSTTIAYGPPEGNGAADLLTQYFLINLLAGASFGRAFLQARQKFVQGQKMEDPVNVKTLAQFILLADPSLHPCRDVGPAAEAAPKVVDSAAARKTRRVALAASGRAAADCSGFPGKKTKSPLQILNLFRKLARKRGFRAHKDHISFFHVVGGAHYGPIMKARGAKQKVMVLVENRNAPAKTKKRKVKTLPQTRVLVAHTEGNRVTKVAEYIRK